VPERIDSGDLCDFVECRINNLLIINSFQGSIPPLDTKVPSSSSPGSALVLLPLVAAAQDASARSAQYHSQDIVPIRTTIRQQIDDSSLLQSAKDNSITVALLPGPLIDL
jgi:hypothetical protein